MLKRIVLNSIFILLLASGDCVTKSNVTSQDLGSEPASDDRMEPKCATYSLMATPDISGTQLHIFCGGLEVYSTSEHFFDYLSITLIDRRGHETHISTKKLRSDSTLSAISNDIDNDNIREIFLTEVIEENGLTSHVVLLLGPTFRKLEYRDYGDTVFRDFDGDGALEFRTADYGITYDRTAPDGGPTGIAAPTVTVSCKGGDFTLLMTPMTFFSGSHRGSLTERGSASKVPQHLDQQMILMIYHGKGDEAFKLFDRLTAGVDAEDKFLFENSLILMLENSADFLEPMMKANHWKFADIEGEAACPEGADRRRFVNVMTAL